MPLFMDRHESQTRRSLTELAAVHERDVLRGPEFGVRWITYYIDSISILAQDGPRVRYSTFCIAEAPATANVQACHMAAHDHVANEVIEIDQLTVEQFLGRIEGPKSFEPWEVSAFRTVLISEIETRAGLTQPLDDRHALKAFQEHERIARMALASKGGKEVRRTDHGIMACFASAAMAIECAIAIQADVARHSLAHPEAAFRARIGLNAGEPVTEHGELFGAAVQLSHQACALTAPGSILVTGVVRDLCLGKGFEFSEHGVENIEGFAEPVRLYGVKAPVNATVLSVPENAHSLSDREIEVIRLIAAGKSNQHIADDLGISLNTVARHVGNIFDKTGAGNRTEAAAYAFHRGLA